MRMRMRMVSLLENYITKMQRSNVTLLLSFPPTLHPSLLPSNPPSFSFYSQVPPPLGYFGELSKVFKEAYTLARDDLSAGKYITVNVLTCVLPFVFIGLSVMLAFLPSDDEVIAPKRAAAPAAVAAAAPAAAGKSEKAD
jgi:hypothetical protein